MYLLDKIMYGIFQFICMMLGGNDTDDKKKTEDVDDCIDDTD